MLREKIIAFNAYIRKGKGKSQNNNLSSHFKKLEKNKK